MIMVNFSVSTTSLKIKFYDIIMVPVNDKTNKAKEKKKKKCN
jgi:hypothetical protein